MTEETLRFPEGFLWGVVSQSDRAEEPKMTNAGPETPLRHGEPAAGRSTPAGIRSSFERLADGIPLLKSLGVTAYRFSLDWCRLEPEEEIWDPVAVEEYRRVLDSLTAAGIVPFVTLSHHAIPPWLAQRGGWESDALDGAFEQYARRAVRSFGTYVRHWITMNDPVLYTYRRYIAGVAPPGVKSWRRALRVCRHLIKGHVRAYHAIHDEAETMRSEVQVGLAKHFRVFDPVTNSSVLDGLTAITFHLFFNDLVPDCLREGILGFPLGFNRYVPDMEGSFDFLGLNYYTRNLVGWRAKYLKQCFRSLGDRIPHGTTARDGAMYPEGLYRLLEHAARYGKPLYITENGIATDDDALRCRFIASHLARLHDAVGMGGDIRGYFHYSLTDGLDTRRNGPVRTGLVLLDGADLQSRIKPSGRFYGGICRQNGLSPELLREYCPNLSD